jgi:hypothetical protein
MGEAADEIERLRRVECSTCAERGYDDADYHRLHRAWCDSVAENERLRAALEKARDQIDDLGWDVNRNLDHILKPIHAALTVPAAASQASSS